MRVSNQQSDWVRTLLRAADLALARLLVLLGEDEQSEGGQVRRDEQRQAGVQLVQDVALQHRRHDDEERVHEEDRVREGDVEAQLAEHGGVLLRLGLVVVALALEELGLDHDAVRLREQVTGGADGDEEEHQVHERRPVDGEEGVRHVDRQEGGDEAESEQQVAGVLDLEALDAGLEQHVVLVDALLALARRALRRLARHLVGGGLATRNKVQKLLL
eukprot:CAMPEP_0174849536 /NCGR_PEP_ID=MMETSP1114-20130205/16541_1 /TAXON_ID=312471 /ORGANISM="Neobodo designis, Strain CCAP 1951/1" /LENGTH=216 /DNA_ID=CAMNT_0016083895 /DNA_START=358 /DNA_END=1004 /DNA_ORIENTATION=-